MARPDVVKRTVMLGALIALMAVGAFAHSQVATPSFAEKTFSPSALNIDGQKLSYLDAKGTPTQRGTLYSEVLRGNGTRAGYVLTHGGIVPSSVRVTAGARSLRRTTDYTLDAVNGALYFAEPVRNGTSISVSYEYVPGQGGARNPMGMNGLALNLRGTALNFGFGVSNVNGLDFNSYGLALNAKMGGASSLSGLLYFSNPADNNRNRMLEVRATPNAPGNTRAAAAQAKSGHLITQNLNLTSGAATFRGTYQDVGATFNGFNAMRQANGHDQDVLGQINMLEKERGVKRLGFGAGLRLGAKSNLNMDWNNIADGQGSIARQAFAYQSDKLNLSWSRQEVGAKFQRFQGLREAEAGQWARERGLTRNDITLGLAPSAGNQLSFSRNEVGDTAGKLSRQLISYTGRNFAFSMGERRAASGFGRIGDLTDAEKTTLALDIRRQYNPDAKANEVTGKDKEQIGLDKGLTRRQMGITSGLGKGGSLAYNQASIDDGSGSVDRRTLNLTGSGFSFSYLDQSIDDGFGRLGHMSDFEKGMLGNERGLRRTSMGLNLALSKGSNLALSQLSLSGSEGGVRRQSLAYTSKGLNVRVNLADTAKSFARAHDMAHTSDAEKKAIEGERGFKRMDFAADLTSIKGLLANTYVYQARNAAEEIGRDIFRHQLAFTPNKSSRIGYLSEGNSTSLSGTVQTGTKHSLLTYDTLLSKGMKFAAYRDTVQTVSGGKAQPIVATNFLHFETNRGVANNLMLETKRIDFGNGSFENTSQLDLNYRASKSLALRFNRLDIDRGKNPSATTDTLDLSWQLSKTLSLNGTLATTGTNNSADVNARSLAIKGLLTNNLNFTGTYMQVDYEGKPSKSVIDVAMSNIKPVNLLGLKDTRFTLKYANTEDKGKKQSQGVTGSVAGKLGANQVAFEYGGSLDTKGNRNVSRGFSIVSDRNEKLPLHFDVSYRAVNINNSGLMLERKYNLDYRMDRLTKLTFNYASLPLNVVNGKQQPTTKSALALSRVLSANLNLSFSYNRERNTALRTASNKLMAMVSGKASKLSTVQVGYSVDVLRNGSNSTDAHTLTLGYDQRIDADHFLALSTTYTTFRNGQSPAVQANVDFKTRF